MQAVRIVQRRITVVAWKERRLEYMKDLKPGDKVVMNDKYSVRPENKGKVWEVRSSPWMVCGTLVVALHGKSGGYAVDGLEKVDV